MSDVIQGPLCDSVLRTIPSAANRLRSGQEGPSPLLDALGGARLLCERLGGLSDSLRARALRTRTLTAYPRILLMLSALFLAAHSLYYGPYHAGAMRILSEGDLIGVPATRPDPLMLWSAIGGLLLLALLWTVALRRADLGGLRGPSLKRLRAKVFLELVELQLGLGRSLPEVIQGLVDAAHAGGDRSFDKLEAALREGHPLDTALSQLDFLEGASGRVLALGAASGDLRGAVSIGRDVASAELELLAERRLRWIHGLSTAAGGFAVMATALYALFQYLELLQVPLWTP